MIVGIKDGMKLIGIFIMSFCAVFVCTLFLNYNIDFAGIKDQITTPELMVLFDALLATGKVVSALAGGCLLLTSGIMLVFYIRNYIDTHKKELGILKALGYSNLRIAKDFQVFALSVFAGTAVGFGGAFLMMPAFYRTQGKDGLLPEITLHFHPMLAVELIIIPTVAFALLAVGYACIKLRQPAIDLLKERLSMPRKPFSGKVKEDASADGIPFLKEVQSATLRSKKTLVFFVAFGSFCYSSMMQMSGSMDELASEMFACMVFIIGVLLSSITLLLAITTVVHGNTKTIAMMRVFGYTHEECKRAVLGGYRPWAYLGFVIGSIYQYAILKIMVSVVFKDWDNVPEYKFDVKTCIIVLISFAILYKLIMYCYAGKIKKVLLKEVMME
ncbi:MAG: ABC transporter permease [Lachnospiraceae bacterium]|nr:ABC transporter permease [Lachnospiraceae bacterium]